MLDREPWRKQPFDRSGGLRGSSWKIDERASKSGRAAARRAFGGPPERGHVSSRPGPRAARGQDRLCLRGRERHVQGPRRALEPLRLGAPRRGSLSRRPGGPRPAGRHRLRRGLPRVPEGGRLASPRLDLARQGGVRGDPRGLRGPDPRRGPVARGLVGRIVRPRVPSPRHPGLPAGLPRVRRPRPPGSRGARRRSRLPALHVGVDRRAEGGDPRARRPGDHGGSLRRRRPRALLRRRRLLGEQALLRLRPRQQPVVPAPRRCDDDPPPGEGDARRARPDPRDAPAHGRLRRAEPLQPRPQVRRRMSGRSPSRGSGSRPARRFPLRSRGPGWP